MSILNEVIPPFSKEGLKLGIYYVNETVEKMYSAAGFQDTESSGFDLMNVETFTLSAGDPFKLVSLGVVIKAPPGYHSIALPRSSTFKRYGLLMANSIGLIDANYCGVDDVWHMPVLFIPNANEDQSTRITVQAGTRLCQFILQERILFHTYRYEPSTKSRGGLGSTGK